MLAEKEVATACPAAENDTDVPAEQRVKSVSPKPNGGGVARHVRRLAKDAAGRHGIPLSDFLAEAIVAYAERLDGGAGTRIDVPADIAGAVEACERRIAALEARLRALETPGKKDGFFARVRLENLVERPWMRNRGY